MGRKRKLRRFSAWFSLRRRWIFRISRDDVSRHVFEHVRNLGLSAVVLGAGHYEQRMSIAADGLFHIIALGFLFGFGSLLYLINMLNAYQKLVAAGCNKNVLLGCGNFYSLFTFLIINSVLRI